MRVIVCDVLIRHSLRMLSHLLIVCFSWCFSIRKGPKVNSGVFRTQPILGWDPFQQAHLWLSYTLEISKRCKTSKIIKWNFDNLLRCGWIRIGLRSRQMSKRGYSVVFHLWIPALQTHPNYGRPHSKLIVNWKMIWHTVCLWQERWKKMANQKQKERKK